MGQSKEALELQVSDFKGLQLECGQGRGDTGGACDLLGAGWSRNFKLGRS